jgi:hypothetical protein
MVHNYNNIFNIPEQNLSQQKLTKAFFLRNFELSTAEKKILNNSIIQMEILAQIFPQKSNIPAVVNDVDSYEQILVVVCTVQDGQLELISEKCIQLLQKYISHQMLLITQDDSEFVINASEKRINQNDKTKLTIERSFTTKKLSKLYKNDHSEAFYKALNFTNVNKTNLQLFYKSYIQAIIQYQVASNTGSFVKRTNKRTEEDMQNLESITILEREIISLRNQIKKENQLNEKVQLNILIKKNKDNIEELKQILRA